MATKNISTRENDAATEAVGQHPHGNAGQSAKQNRDRNQECRLCGSEMEQLAKMRSEGAD